MPSDKSLPECDRAHAKSEVANDSGDPADHAAAASAHDRAAKAAFKAGLPDLGKLHAKKAKGHKVKSVDPKKTPLTALLAGK